MNDYQNLFKDLRYEVWKVSFLNAFLNAAIAFFISNIICTLINTRYIFSLVPAIIVFIYSFWRKVRQYTLRKIEEGNPEVAEILRTAHDNKSNDSLLVHALFLELMQRMETVTAGVFIHPKRTLFKMLAIAILAFVPIIITSFLSFLIIDNPFAGADVAIRNALNGDEALAPVTPIDDAGDRDIYGNRDVVNLGNEKLDITTNSGAGGVDFTKTEDAQGRTFRQNDYPLDVSAEQTTAGTGGNVEESDLVNDYSCKTKGTC